MRAAAIAVYPMYKGVASLVGMDVVDFEGERPADEMTALERVWDDYDFFFVHIKKTDSYGEDGNFDAKVHEIEAVDAVMPRLLASGAGRSARDRRSQYAGEAAQPQLASGADDACGARRRCRTRCTSLANAHVRAGTWACSTPRTWCRWRWRTQAV